MKYCTEFCDKLTNFERGTVFAKNKAIKQDIKPIEWT